jgi:hypothetical protein
VKKAIAIALSACLLLCGCGGNSVRREEGAPKENVGGRFLCDSSSYDFETVVDSKTGVTYLVLRNAGASAIGGITVLLNADGTPVISEEVSV